MRHLDTVHLYARSPVRFQLLADYVILFIEAIVFIAMAESVDTPPQFIYTVWVLLAVDVVWGLATIGMSPLGESAENGPIAGGACIG